MNDHALDALLAEYVAPPLPPGLAGRVAAAALALPQEPRLAYARRGAAVPRHDRRGKWLRRPLLVGGVALGLAVSGAVAATLAGLRIDWPAVEEMLADLPFLGRETPTDSAVPPRATPPAPPVVEPATAEPGRAAPRGDEAPPAPRALTTAEQAAPAAIHDQGARRADVTEARLVERRPAAQPPGPDIELARPAPPPAATVEREATAPNPVAEPRAPAPVVDEARLRQERIERTERLRSARQAQIERLQRVQQRRERIRRLRRQ